ncbi:MAG: type II secretion system GspH family protein [Candidatus Omnitrophica bacterium]|nr:type II secretion system GspH family protein [Candidatus Omnitrophota bacterium]
MYKKNTNKSTVSFNKSIKGRSLAGFTIIELLTVLVIITVVGYTTSLAVMQISKSYTKIKSVREILDLSRTIMKHLTRDLESAYIATIATNFRFLGTNITIDFNTWREASSGISEVIEVGYSLGTDNDGDGDFPLMRRIETGTSIPNQINSGGTDYEIADNVFSLRFTYVYKDSAGDLQTTTGTWDSSAENFGNNVDYIGENKDPDGLPDAVAVTFQLFNNQGPTYTTTIFLPPDKDKD